MSYVIFLAKHGLDPLSYNRIYCRTKQGHTFLVEEGRKYKKDIADAIMDYYIRTNKKFPVLNHDEYFKLTLEWYIDIWFKNGKPRSRDCSNYIKVVEDAIANFIKYDDSYNFEVITRKLDFKRSGFLAPVIFIKLEVINYIEVENNAVYLNYLKGY